jgi:hypothetical protein
MNISAANEASESEIGKQSRTEKILSLFDRLWVKVKHSWKEEIVRKYYKS